VRAHYYRLPPVTELKFLPPDARAKPTARSESPNPSSSPNPSTIYLATSQVDSGQQEREKEEGALSKMEQE
jgi:hypothetical protein